MNFIRYVLIVALFLVSCAISYLFGKTRIVLEPPPTRIIYQSRDLPADKIWASVNFWRKNNNLPELQKSDKLCDYASIRIADLKTEWSHTGFDKRSGWFMKDSGFNHLGENLGNFNDSMDAYLTDTSAIIGMWMNSPSHRENMENRAFSYGCVVADGGYVVNLFGGY